MGAKNSRQIVEGLYESAYRNATQNRQTAQSLANQAYSGYLAKWGNARNLYLNGEDLKVNATDTEVVVIGNTGPLPLTNVRIVKKGFWFLPDTETNYVDIGPGTHTIFNLATYQFTVDEADAIRFDLFGNEEETTIQDKVIPFMPFFHEVTTRPYYPSTALSFENATLPSESRPFLAYGWSFGDGSNAGTEDAPHRYVSPGNYDVTLTAQDGAGHTSVAKQTIGIQNPIVSDGGAFCSAFSGLAPLSITCDALHFRSLDSIPLHYEWQFGNGDSSTLPEPTYTYHQPGKYVMSLRVYQSDQVSSSIQETVQVESPVHAKFTASESQCVTPGMMITFDGSPSRGLRTGIASYS